MARYSLLAAAAVSAAALIVSVDPALAKCTKLGFSVNDYGKDGPIKDAKSLLDKYIADWASKRGITKYTTGKKDVTCELFLDFGFFDEHTCKATATVCWGGEGGTAASGDAPAADTPAKKPVAKKASASPGDTPAKKAPAAAAVDATAKKAPAAAAPAKAPPPVKKKADQPA